MNLSEWNDALFDVVVRKGTAGAPLFVFVDRSVLAAARELPEPEAALEDFRSAFVARGQLRPFDSSTLSTQRWLKSGAVSIPPFFADLCMTVLAVTEPSLDQASGVYMTQNHLLGLPLTTDAPPGYSEDVPRLWSLWNRWLEAAGSEFGTVTASTHPRWTYQGWPRSQAHIRARERDTIFEFFDAKQPDSLVDGVELFRSLQVWLEFRGLGYERFRTLLRDEQVKDLLVTLLPTFQNNWMRTNSTRERKTIFPSLARDSTTGWMDLVVDLTKNEWVRGAHITSGGEQASFSDRDPLHYITPEGANSGILGRPTVIPLNAKLTARWSPRRVIFLRPWDDSTWLECSEPSIGIELNALVEQREMAIVLEQIGLIGSAVLSTDSPAPGWQVLTDLRFTSAPASELGRRTLGWDFVDSQSTARLAGGMPMGSASVYLEGGAPDVVSTPGDAISVDGTERSHVGGGGVFSIEDLYLSPGTHTVTVGELRLRFRLVAPSRIAPVPWAAEGTDSPSVPSDQSDPNPITRSSLTRSANAQIYLLLRSGEAAALDASQLSNPKWLEALGLTELALIDFTSVVPSRFSGEVAFIAFRASPTAKWTLVDVPVTTRFRGSTPEIIAELTLSSFVAAADKRWLPRENRQKLAALLNQRPHRNAAEVRPATSKSSLFVDRALSSPHSSWLTNPYDDFLGWLSELESGVSSIHRARQVWNWLLGRRTTRDREHSFEAALRKLAALSHVDVDWVAQKVRVRPTQFSSVPNGMGLRVWQGARPSRVVAALISGDADDAEDALQSFAHNSQILRAEQPLIGDTPIGPDALFLEVPDYSNLRADTRALKFFLNESGPLPVEAVRALSVSDLAAATFINPFGTQRNTLKLSDWKHFSWAPPSNREDRFGVGQYLTSRGPVYTFRSRATELELVCDFHEALWRWMSEQHAGSLVGYQPRSGILLAPRSLGLPRDVEAYLLQRSGILPQPVRVQTPIASGHLVDFNAYVNLTSDVAEATALALGQRNPPQLIAMDIPMRHRSDSKAS